MARRTRDIPVMIPAEFQTFAGSFRRELEVANKSPNAIDTYPYSDCL